MTLNRVQKQEQVVGCQVHLKRNKFDKCRRSDFLQLKLYFEVLLILNNNDNNNKNPT